MTTIYGFYKSLMRELNVPNHEDAYGKIISEDYEFHKYYYGLNQNQIGGGNTIKYVYGDHNFIIHQIEEDDRTTFSIYNNSDDESNESCMVLFLPRKDNYIYVETISYYENCSFPVMPKTKGGSLLLKTMLSFVDSIKNKYKLRYIQLRDTSGFACHRDKTSTHIANLYMLTRGDTWYGKYGFVPFNLDKRQIDIDLLADYKTNQRLVKLVKVKYTNIRDYLIKASYKPHLKRYTEKMIDKMIRAYNDRPIMDFFKDFTEKYDVSCDMFNAIYKDVMTEIGLVDFYGKTFYLPLV
jgi:hypothetical protein